MDTVMETNIKANNITVSVVGLGYVGLPVAVAFGKVRRTIGFDINSSRIAELKVANFGIVVNNPYGPI